MVNKMRFILLFSFVLVLAFSCSSKRNRILTEDEAIARAEEFIKDNGYTDLPPTEDKSRLVPEPVFGGTDEDELKLRHNTLQAKAYGIIQGGRTGEGWYVVFRYNSNNAENYGRAVSMNGSGENLKVEHQDIGFESRRLKRINR